MNRYDPRGYAERAEAGEMAKATPETVARPDRCPSCQGTRDRHTRQGHHRDDDMAVPGMRTHVEHCHAERRFRIASIEAAARRDRRRLDLESRWNNGIHHKPVTCNALSTYRAPLTTERMARFNSSDALCFST